MPLPKPPTAKAAILKPADFESQAVPQADRQAGKSGGAPAGGVALSRPKGTGRVADTGPSALRSPGSAGPSTTRSALANNLSSAPSTASTGQATSAAAEAPESWLQATTSLA